MEIKRTEVCEEFAYGKGPYPSVAYYVELPDFSRDVLGTEDTLFPVTYQMLNVQKASH